MKIFSRATIKFSVFLSLFLCFGQTVSAQENKCDQPDSIQEKLKSSYQKYLDNHRSDDPEKLKIALEAAKDYIKITNDNLWCDDVSAYFREVVVILEKEIKSKSIASTQENQCKQITFEYLITKLESTLPEVGYKEKIFKELKSEIIERKVIFDLNRANEKQLKSVGADDLLIKTIRENVLKASEEEISLYNLFVKNFESKEVEGIKKAIKAAREYIRKFENDGCHIELVEYFKTAVPVLEKSLESLKSKDDIYDPASPKVVKYLIMKKLTDEFKAKNWDEVFALGRKVYELDPEFVPIFTDLASLGFEQAKLYGSKSKHNAETVFYAELAVKLMENSKKDFPVYGGLGYSYKTKAEALEKMKEILGFMKK